MKYVFFIFLFFSCNNTDSLDQENPFAEIKQEKIEKQKSSKITQGNKEITNDLESCLFGCSYYHKIINGLKVAKEDSIILSITQIKSIRNECVKVCKATYK